MTFARPSVRYSILRALFCILLIFSLSEQANAHDPLHEDDHAGHRTHKAVHHDAQPIVDLARIRSLILAFRRTGDDRNLDAAWATLTPALEESIIKSETLVVAAFVAQSRHQFEYAASLLDRALEINNRNDEAWLLKASIHMVMGDSAQAISACKNLRGVSALILITCQARVAVLSGDAHSALGGLQRVLTLAGSKDSPPEFLAWSLSVAGDLAAVAGNNDQARRYFERSLAMSERTQVRAAFVDVLLEQAEFETALAAIPSTSTALPLVIRRLIALKQLHRIDELADISARVASEFEMWIADEDWLHAREMTRFYLDVIDRPLLARRLADVNFELQREPEDVRLVMRTRTLHRADSPSPII